MWTAMWFAHDRDDGDLGVTKRERVRDIGLVPLTPEAVLIGRARNFGKSAFLYSSGTALIISTNLGTPL